MTRRSGATPALPVRLLSVQEVAAVVQVPVKTIYQWRHRGEGPRPMRLGKYLRFDPVDVATWIEARKVCSAERQGR